jgi:hypothetical protein
MSEANPRELAHREQDGLEVTLLWDPRSNDVSVEVVDLRGDTFVQIPVRGRCALDAFQRPYAYVPKSEYAVGLAAEPTTAE